MTYIKREIEKEVAAFLQDDALHKNVLLVEGARQAGKSTVISHVLESHKGSVVSINLEKQPRMRAKIDQCIDFEDFTAFVRDELRFIPGNGRTLFIDESQESMKLGEFVRFMKEEWAKTSVILSGSTLSRLFRDDTRYPVGRVQRLIVTPLSFTEYLRAVGDEHLTEYLPDPARISPSRHEYLLGKLDDYLTIGGLPAVVVCSTEGKEWRERREEISADLERDFIRIFGEDTFPIVASCLRSVAHFAGNPFKNTSVVANPDTRMNHRINLIFSRLEAWHLVIRSEQSGTSPEHSFAYHPKRYLFDTGVLRMMRETATPSLRLLERNNVQARTHIGGIIENQVAVDLSRNGQSIGGWKKSSSGNSIDFIVKINEQALPVECKASLALKGTHLRGTMDYLRFYRQSHGCIVSAAPFEIRPLPDTITIVNIPLYSAEYCRKIIADTVRKT